MVVLFSQPNKYAIRKKGEQNDEEICDHYQHDDGDVHALHVLGFLRSFFRYVLHLRS